MIVGDASARGIPEVLDEAGIAAERLLGVGIGVPGIVEQTRPRRRGRARPDHRLGRRPTGGVARASPRFARHGALPTSTTVPRRWGQAEMWFGAGRGAQQRGRGALRLRRRRQPSSRAESTGPGGGMGAPDGTGAAAAAAAAARAVAWRRTRARRPLLHAGVRRAGDHPRARTRRSRPDRDARRRLPRPDAPGPARTRRHALAVLEETAEYLGAGLSDLINLFQPERILVGGWAGLQLGPASCLAYAATRPRTRCDLPGRARAASTSGPLGPDARHRGGRDPAARRLLLARRPA
ncbi:hypothetical protein LV779_02010 [Streptomyces thinghirensis]|nr:hypothetical protein [Streptomyces thinghirensis]